MHTRQDFDALELNVICPILLVAPLNPILRIPCGGSLTSGSYRALLKRHVSTDFRLVARIVTYVLRLGIV